MTTPAERRELFLDAQEQTEDWAREQRAEYYDAPVLADERDDQPDAAELAEMARWDRITEREERQ